MIVHVLYTIDVQCVRKKKKLFKNTFFKIYLTIYIYTITKALNQWCKSIYLSILQNFGMD